MSDADDRKHVKQNAEAERIRLQFKATKEHWDRVFAEPWAQEYLAKARGER